MSEMRTQWTYPLIGTSGTRRGPRTSTPAGRASRITGINGNDEGGLRPSTGFKWVLDLDYGYGSDAQLNADGGFIAGGTMKGWQPVTFRISDNKYAHGFVYQVVSGGKAVYRLKFKISGETDWRTDHSMGFTKGLLTAPEDYANEQFDVEVFGRFVYCFRSTKQPFVFYVTEPTVGNYVLVVREETGGGPAPSLINPSANSLSALDDITTVVTAMTAPSTGDAEGRVIFWGFSDAAEVSVNGSGTPLSRNPFVTPRGTPGTTDQAIIGPSETGLWTTEPQPDPSFSDFLPYSAGAPLTPTYPFPATYGEYSGVKWDKGTRPADVPMGVGLDAANNAVWAYRLYDSRTGLLSPLSNRLSAREDGYGSAAFDVSETTVNGQRVTSWNNVTFPMFQVIYKHAKYDTLLLYRGRAQQSINTDEVVLSLEAQLTLADYHIDTQPGDTNWKVAAYFTTLTDQELSQQETFGGDDVFAEEMPYAGSALFYEATMLLGKMGLVDQSVGGVGKFVWSSLNTVSVELVPPSNRYVLQIPDEEIERFLRLGPNVLGLSRISQYLIRREYNFLKALPLHLGYGVVGARAAAEVGSDVYFVANHGLCAVTPDGALSDVDVLDHLIQNDWASSIEQVELAFDAACSCLFVLNPTKDHTACLWMKRGRMTEFVDTPFLHVAEGDVQVSSGKLKRQAIFVQYQEIGANQYRWRVYVFDHDRTKTEIQLLNPKSGNRIFQLSDKLSTGDTTITVQSTLPDDIGGCYIYVMSGSAAGEKVKVVRKLSTNTASIEEYKGATTSEKAYVGLGPVVVEWTGHQLGLQAEDGYMFGGPDFHAARHLDSLVATFSTVTKPSWVPGELARYQAFAYLGDDTTEKDKRFPEGTRREDVQSIESGPSHKVAAFSDPSDISTSGRYGVHGWSLHPGVRIFVPGMDYRLLSVKAYGNIRDDDAIRAR